MFQRLSESLCAVARELRELRVQRQIEFEWLRSSLGLATKYDLREVEKNIMATQAEIVADLRTANAQLRKLVTDTAAIQPAVDALKAKIIELEALIADGGAIGQELIDVVAETKSLAQTVDDNVPEQPSPPA